MACVAVSSVLKDYGQSRRKVSSFMCRGNLLDIHSLSKYSPESDHHRRDVYLDHLKLSSHAVCSLSLPLLLLF